MDIIDKIFELIKQNGTTASAVSNATGIKQATFSQWKKRLQQPSIANIKLLADYFNVSLDYLLGNEQKEKSPLSKESELAEILSLLNDEGAAKVLEYAKLLRLQQEHQEQVDK